MSTERITFRYRAKGLGVGVNVANPYPWAPRRGRILNKCYNSILWMLIRRILAKLTLRLFADASDSENKPPGGVLFSVTSVCLFLSMIVDKRLRRSII